MHFIEYVILVITGVENLTKWLFLFVLLWLIVTPFLKKFTKNHSRKKLIRSILGIIPLILSIIYTAINFRPATYDKFFVRGGILSLILIFASIIIFIPDSKKDKKFDFFNVIKGVLNGISVMLMIVLVYQFGFTNYVSDYSHLGWADSFSSMIDSMSVSYSNRNWKQIDFESLKEKYVPLVKAAEENDDKQAFAKVLLEYQYEFYDSHIWFADNCSVLSLAEEELIGNDYGMSMYKLNNGDTIAILVDEDSQAEKAGIHNGTIIKEWDGVNVDEAMKNVRCLDYWFQFEVIENEELMKPIFLAGQGGDKVDVTFIDDDNKTKTVTLDAIGKYKSRESTALTYLYSDNRISNDNFSYKMLNDDVGYLRISAEHYSNDIIDIIAMLKGNYKKVYDETDKKLQELSDNGMKYLVIDLRHNRGGYEVISTAVASLFADSKLTSEDGIDHNGKIVSIAKFHTFNEGKWKDLPVAVLVNDAAVSSGDVLIHLLSQCPNVTIMGITSSSNSLQAIGGLCYLSDDIFEIYYPIFNTPDGNGGQIEVTADRQAKVGFDVRIPVDLTSAIQIFSDNTNDYELEYAINYLYDICNG